MPKKLKSVPRFIEDDYPGTEGSFRWLLFQRHENDLTEQGVVVNIGKRLYIDCDKWDDWLHSRQPNAAA